MDPQILVLLLVLAGIALIFAELFLPSGGLIAVICACCFLGSGYFAYQAWYELHPLFWWGYLAGVAIIIPSSIIGGFQLLTRTALGNRVLMPAPTTEEVTPYQAEREHLSSLIGQRGHSLNLMTPGGLVHVNGERLHAISEGLMIEPNQPIEIVGVRGNRVIVQQVDAESHLDLDTFDEPSPSPEDQVDPWLSDDAKEV